MEGRSSVGAAIDYLHYVTGIGNGARGHRTFAHILREIRVATNYILAREGFYFDHRMSSRGTVLDAAGYSKHFIKSFSVRIDFLSV